MQLTPPGGMTPEQRRMIGGMVALVVLCFIIGGPQLGALLFIVATLVMILLPDDWD